MGIELTTLQLLFGAVIDSSTPTLALYVCASNRKLACSMPTLVSVSELGNALQCLWERLLKPVLNIVRIDIKSLSHRHFTGSPITGQNIFPSWCPSLTKDCMTYQASCLCGRQIRSIYEITCTAVGKR